MDACARENRVLVLIGEGRQRETAHRRLEQAGIVTRSVRNPAELLRELGRGAAEVVATAKSLEGSGLGRLEEFLRSQPRWSGVPVLVLTRRTEEDIALILGTEALKSVESVTFLELPIGRLAFLSAVRAGLADRRRQYVLRNLVRRLEGQVRHRDDFLAVLGHEIRNPLAAIASATEVVRHLEGEPGPTQAAIGILSRQTRQLSRVVKDLLDVARVSRGRIRLVRRRVDLRRIAEWAVDSLRDAARMRGIRLELLFGSKPSFARADEDRIGQVITELVDNALDSTDSGGRVVVCIAGRGPSALLRVRDSGIGLTEDEIGGIFDPYVRTERSRRRYPERLGLGLFLARRLVEMHGGEIRAMSGGVGRGSEFRILLPLAGRAGGGDGTDNERVARDTVGSVLLVTGDPVVREPLHALFAAEGYRVRSAWSAQGAIRSFRLMPPRLVVLDGRTPSLDIEALAHRLRGEARGRGIHFLEIPPARGIHVSELQVPRNRKRIFRKVTGGV